jgi:hypothetical protein
MRCGACGWLVYADSASCKHCLASREAMLAPRAPAPAAPRCPKCAGRVLASSARCKHCGHELGA